MLLFFFLTLCVHNIHSSPVLLHFFIALFYCIFAAACELVLTK